MSEYCTCGAQLPPDARFCHKCGRPLFAEAPVDDVPSVAPPEALPAVLPLNFQNRVAVRAGLSAAAIAALLSSLPLLNYGFIVWLAAAGFFAVYQYRRRTGQRLTVVAGARLGWITGVLSFAIITVLFTINVLAMISRSGSLANLYREQMQNMPIRDPNFEQALQILQTPAGTSGVLVFLLLFLFLISTLMCIVGGALGAKIVGKD